MAGNNYKLLIEAELDTTGIEATIKSKDNKYTILMKAQLDKTGIDQFNKIFDDIQQRAKEIGKVKFFEGDDGKISKAVVQYTDNMNNARTATISLGKELSVVETLTQNIGKDSKELARAALNADKFLAKAGNMSSDPNVLAAKSKAVEIKGAVADKDIARVRQLNDEFAILKSRLQAGKTGFDSLAYGIKNAIKQTIEYSLSIGLVYGALKQIKDGVQYITELNTEMTKIQVLQIDGAKTNDQIANLAMQYNDLAKQVGSTTIEVAKGIFYNALLKFS